MNQKFFFFFSMSRKHSGTFNLRFIHSKQEAYPSFCILNAKEVFILWGPLNRFPMQCASRNTDHVCYVKQTYFHPRGTSGLLASLLTSLSFDLDRGMPLPLAGTFINLRGGRS